MAGSNSEGLDGLIKGKSLQELEKLQMEKKLFLNRLESVLLCVPTRIQKRNQEISKLQQEHEQDIALLSKAKSGAKNVRTVVSQVDQEIKRRKQSNPAINLTIDDLVELDKITSMLGGAAADVEPAMACIFDEEETESDSPAPTLSSSTTSSPPLIASKMKLIERTKGSNLLSVSQLEDLRITKLIANRWQILRTNRLKHKLEPYHTTRAPRQFEIEIPQVEPCPASTKCTACNRHLNEACGVCLADTCDKCFFHPVCAAVHLDFLATQQMSGAGARMQDDDDDDDACCLGKIFLKCPYTTEKDAGTAGRHSVSQPPPTSVIKKKHS